MNFKIESPIMENIQYLDTPQRNQTYEEDSLPILSTYQNNEIEEEQIQRDSSFVQDLSQIQVRYQKALQQKQRDFEEQDKFRQILINLSEKIEYTFQQVESALQNVNMKKGFTYEDEIRMQFRMDNLVAYPLLQGVSYENSYLYNLNSRYGQYSQCPRPQDVIQEGVEEDDMTEEILHTTANRITFKNQPNQMCITHDGSFPQPMRQVLQTTHEHKQTDQNCLIYAVSYQIDKGESDCVQWHLRIGEQANDLQERVDFQRLRDYESDASSIPWNGSQMMGSQMYKLKYNIIFFFFTSFFQVILQATMVVKNTILKLNLITYKNDYFYKQLFFLFLLFFFFFFKMSIQPRAKSLPKQTENIKQQPQLVSKQIESTTDDKEQLKISNDKLKQQLRQLIRQLDQILIKEQMKKIKKNSSNDSLYSDPFVLDLQNQLKKKEAEIKQNKTLIEGLKRTLEQSFDVHKYIEYKNQISRIVEAENMFKLNKKVLQELENEEQSLVKVRKNQDQALNNLQDDDTNKYISETQKKIIQVKEHCRALYEQVQDLDKQQKKSRDQILMKQKKIDEFNVKIKEVKKISNINVTEDLVKQIENEIEALELEKVQEDRKQMEKVKILEYTKQDLKFELEKKCVTHENKLKELKINKLRYAEIQRLVRCLNDKPSEARSNSYAFKPNLSRKSQRSESAQVNENLQQPLTPSTKESQQGRSPLPDEQASGKAYMTKNCYILKPAQSSNKKQEQ